LEDQNWHSGSPRDSYTSFKVKRSKVKSQGVGHIVAASVQLVIVMPLPRQDTGIVQWWPLFVRLSRAWP